MTEDIKDVIERLCQFADSDLAGYDIGEDLDTVLAHVDALTRERDEARAERDRLDELNAIAVRFVDALRAEVERLKREREEARRDTREVSMFARHVAKAGPDAVEAMRARCERIAEEIGDDITDAEGLSPLDVSMAIKGAIASLKVEGAPDPRDADIVAVRGRTWTLIANEELDAMRAEIAALREALDDAESWIERHQEDAHDGAEWASLLTKIDCAMRASAALTAPCSTCGRGFRKGATP